MSPLHCIADRAGRAVALRPGLFTSWGFGVSRPQWLFRQTLGLDEF
eukprot:COSAG02_NODE_374_length_23583_cov_12.568855_9_plen_46_part_00